MINVLITGSTGMIGKGVLLECLRDDNIRSVTLINRSAIDVQRPKIREILLKDFTQIESIKDQLGPIDACFHCMGISAMGLTEAQYDVLTFEVTQKLADLCFEHNPDMTFNYVSGTGTDSSEKGRVMWARVKGKTENYVFHHSRPKGLKGALCFVPDSSFPKIISSRALSCTTISTSFSVPFSLFSGE
jgi:nucleoside-diphosphate-sugar epimerase